MAIGPRDGGELELAPRDPHVGPHRKASAATAKFSPTSASAQSQVPPVGIRILPEASALNSGDVTLSDRTVIRSPSTDRSIGISPRSSVMSSARVPAWQIASCDPATTPAT
jgi:hypothetical protein